MEPPMVSPTQVKCIISEQSSHAASQLAKKSACTQHGSITGKVSIDPSTSRGGLLSLQFLEEQEAEEGYVGQRISQIQDISSREKKVRAKLWNKPEQGELTTTHLVEFQHTHP
ncbi:hypothetical protein TCAL_08295 [Tigriopus californicus]|uniref:Uncharacterized protein n=1 Tax=Tigriopus californicus TaxID=6832 RepID=A0A553NBS1_TIGCA|nr:hypothetical protein TCAL_08295 [Tigriopus californicus]